MRWLRQHWLAVVFILLTILASAVFVAMAAGWLRLDSEWPGLVVGAVLVALLLLLRIR